MIISHTRRLIIFSNPKTGSETLRATFAALGEEPVVPWRATSRLYPFYPHMPPCEAQRVFRQRGWPFDSYTRVTAIRNPYARLVSLYRMILRSDGVWRLRSRAGLPPPEFADWLRTTRPDGRGGGGRPHQRWRRFGTYSVTAWTQDAGGAPLVTHILRLERLKQDLAPLLSSLDMPLPEIPVQNAAPGTRWQSWYDPATARLVADRYADEIAQFYPSLCTDPDLAIAA